MVTNQQINKSRQTWGQTKPGFTASLTPVHGRAVCVGPNLCDDAYGIPT